jgi:hypothetical protein
MLSRHLWGEHLRSLCHFRQTSPTNDRPKWFDHRYGIYQYLGLRTVGPVNIQTSASNFLGKQIHQAWARISKKYLKRANI